MFKKSFINLFPAYCRWCCGAAANRIGTLLIGFAVGGGVLAMSWKEHIAAISAQASFSAPAEEQALLAAETQLGMRLPQSLRELLAESNGVRGEYDLALIWPVERIVADNRSFRESEAFRTSYMPFEGLLFFADAGKRRPVCFRCRRRPGPTFRHLRVES
jgi:SMI1 / KNR4 family (SUKH-1)